MRMMKDSGIEWIGEIPESWVIRRIKTSFEIVAGATPKSGEASYWDGDIPWITPADYTTNDIYVSAGHKNITQEGLDSCATSLIQAGSIIFSKRAPVGLVAINRNPLCTNQGCLSCIPRDSVDVKYHYYAISIYSEQFDLFASGTTFKEISADVFANFKLPYPDYNTQKQIAAFLDIKCAEIDALIAAKEKTNALLRERRQSIIYEAVTKGLDPTVPMKDSGVEWIGEIPEGWSLWRMKHLAAEPLQYGANATGIEYNSDLPRYVRITDITADRMLSEDGKQSLPEDIARDYMLKDGDILFARSGATSGKSFYYDEAFGNCCFAGYLIRFCPDSQKAISKFLYYYTLTRAYEQWTQRIFIQATIQNISAEKYENLVFAIPPTLEKQMEIVTFLDQECSALERSIQHNESIILKLKEYRQSLIFEAVTGKITI